MIIVNAILVTWEEPNRILENQALLIEKDRIREIGPNQEMVRRYPNEAVLDAKGQYVLPGNICAHTHFYGAFARGMAVPEPTPKDLPEILKKIWWPLDKALTHEDIRFSTLVCLVDAIKHGTTLLIDHHASANAIDGSLDVIAEAVEQSGLRAVLCYEVSDRDGPEKAQAGIAENARFIKSLSQRNSPSLAATFGLHASLTLSDATLDACKQACPKEGFHIHAAESEADEYDSLAKSGMRVVDRLEKHGLLGIKSIAAHAVAVDASEIQQLANSGTWVTHQPRSNMNNATGVAEVESMLNAGVRVGLGNDGLSNAMWEEWKCAYLIHKAWHRDPRRMNAVNIIRMAVYNNAALANSFFQDAPIGKIVPGAYADLILAEYRPFTPVTSENLPWHILFGFNESMITTTVAGGKVVMKERKLLTLDEESIAAHARELAPKIWKRYEENLIGDLYD